MIDSHQHFWQTSRNDCEWPTPDLKAIYQNFMPEDYLLWSETLGISGSVLVQSQACDSDTDFIIDIARNNSFVRAVVGWVDLTSSTALERLDSLANETCFRGIRPMLQNIQNTQWILKDDVAVALKKLELLGLSFDALVQPRHLPALCELAKKFPGLPIVIDHCAKPDIRKSSIHRWASHIEKLAECSNVYCKLSGLLTEANPEQWNKPEFFAPYVQHLINCFGVSRLMWGSDWPVVNLAVNAETWYKQAEGLVRKCCKPDEQSTAIKHIFSETAKHFYRIE